MHTAINKHVPPILAFRRESSLFLIQSSSFSCDRCASRQESDIICNVETMDFSAITKFVSKIKLKKNQVNNVNNKNKVIAKQMLI